MIPRKITSELLLQLNEYPIVTVIIGVSVEWHLLKRIFCAICDFVGLRYALVPGTGKPNLRNTGTGLTL